MTKSKCLNKVANQTINKIEIRRSSKIKSIISETALTSTVHGIPNIFKTDKKLLKIIWSTVFFISLTYSICLVWQAISNYLKYPVNTKVGYYTDKQILFPVVAFCNTNAFVTEYSNDYASILLNNVSFNQSNNTIEYLNMQLNTVNSLIYKMLTFAFFQNDTEKKKFGFELNETLIKCMFKNKPCDLNDFTWYYDFFYGNCFAFNKFNTNNTIQAPGDSNMLTLELYAGLENSIISSTGSLGFNLMIYNQTEDDSLSNLHKITLNTNTEFNIVINRVFMKKLASPYSECLIDSDVATVDSYDSDLFRATYKANKTYKQSDCFVHCFKMTVNQICKCDLVISSASDSKQCLTENELKCLNDLYNNVFKVTNNFQSECDAKCPLECNLKYFDFEISSQRFPSTYYAKYLLRNNSFLSRLACKHELTIEDLKLSASRVNVYLENMNYQYFEEVATYSVNDLIGIVGGSLGLFVGASFLSFFELFEILFEVIYSKMNF